MTRKKGSKDGFRTCCNCKTIFTSPIAPEYPYNRYCDDCAEEYLRRRNLHCGCCVWHTQLKKSFKNTMGWCMLYNQARHVRNFACEENYMFKTASRNPKKSRPEKLRAIALGKFNANPFYVKEVE